MGFPIKVQHRWLHLITQSKTGCKRVQSVTRLQILRSICTYHSDTNGENILALAAIKDWHLWSLDISHTYLNGELDVPVYMEQPEGFMQGDQKRTAYSTSHYADQNRADNSGTNDYTKF